MFSRHGLGSFSHEHQFRLALEVGIGLAADVDPDVVDRSTGESVQTTLAASGGAVGSNGARSGTESLSASSATGDRHGP
jgi:hypothetical protein